MRVMTLEEAIRVVEHMEETSAALLASWGNDEPDPRDIRGKMRLRADAMREVLSAAKRDAALSEIIPLTVDEGS